MKKLKLLFILVLPLFLSCSGEDINDLINSVQPSGGSNSANADYAPETLKVGQCINWWGSQFINGDKYAEASKSNPNAIQILNSTDHQPFWYSDWGTYTYNKTGKNSATLYFVAPRRLNGVVQTFTYSMKLSFYSATSFKMTGSLKVWHSLNGTTYCTLDCYGVLNNSHGSSGFVEQLSNTNSGSSNANGNNNSIGGSVGTGDNNAGTGDGSGNSSNINDLGTLSCPDENHPHAIDMGLSVKWSCCNVGTNVPTQKGTTYAWGETIDTRGSSNNYKYVYRKNPLPLSADAAYVNMGDSWRMPTFSELEELINKCVWRFGQKDMVTGYMVESKDNEGKIFIPYYSTTSTYWSSSPSDKYPGYGIFLSITNKKVSWGHGVPNLSHPIRPVCSK